MEKRMIGPARAVGIELVLFLAYAFSSASWLVGSILTTDVVAQFGMDGVPASVNNAISIAKIVGNFAAAYILIKLKPKKAVLLASLLISCVMIGAFATNFPVFILSRFLLGLGGAILLICLAPYVVYCFEPNKRPIFNGLNSVGPNTGNLLALLSIAPVRHWMGSWQNVIIFYGVFSILFLVIWLFVGKDYPMSSTSQSAPKDYTYQDGLKARFLYQYVFTYTGLFVMYIVLLYLFPLNPSFTVNSTTISLLIAAGGIAGTVIGIFVARKVDKDILNFRICGILQTAVFFFMIFTKSAAAVMICAVVLGLLIFIPTPAFTTLPSKLPDATPRKVAILITLHWTLTYVIQMIVYSIIVWIVNHVGWTVAMYVTAAYSITFFLGSFLLPDLSHPPKNTTEKE